MNYYKDIYNLNNLKTLYLGGGNPLIDIELFIKINEFLYSSITLDSIIEYTIESNIRDINQQIVYYLILFKVNRVSLGVQSFCKKSIVYANREYTTIKNLLNVLDILSKNNIDINLDFIIGLPYSDPEKEIKTIEYVLKNDFNITHLSFYELTISDNSYWSRVNNIKINEKNIVKYENLLKDLLLKYNFNRYEISNYSKKGKECLHNIGYWKYKNFLGLGPSAHSKIDNIRIENKPDLKEYINNNYREVIKLNKLDILKEFFLMSLRLIEGINVIEFKERFNYNPLDLIKNTIEKYKNLFIIGENIRLNEEGLNILNKILIDIFIELEKKS